MERKKHTQKKMFTVFSIQSSFFGHLNQPRRKVTNESGHAIESVTEMQKTHLNTGQVKVRYSDVSVIQIPTIVFKIENAIANLICQRAVQND